MSRISLYIIDLSEAEQEVREHRSRCYAAPHREVLKANTVFLAAGGWADVGIALDLGTHVNVVSKSRSPIGKSLDRRRPAGQALCLRLGRMLVILGDFHDRVGCAIPVLQFLAEYRLPYRIASTALRKHRSRHAGRRG
jgi:hypothetical protein